MDLESSADGGIGDLMALWDWRRQVARLYATAAGDADPRDGWTRWRAGRDHLFATHPQSPLDSRAQHGFDGLPFFDYADDLRIEVGLVPADGPAATFEAGRDGPLAMHPFAMTDGLADRLGGELTLFWITGYGGGAFLPFADATSGKASYGAGRYLLDTIKGADLGHELPGRITLDFNFAYNPSCSYSERWICPLAPPSNRLPKAVEAGERVWQA